MRAVSLGADPDARHGIIVENTLGSVQFVRYAVNCTRWLWEISESLYDFRMVTMNISLPDNLKIYVDERVRSGGYGTTSDYFRELVHRDQSGDRLRQLLLEGAASPVEGPVDDAFFDRLKERIGRRAEK